jgi:hypothetical protein
MTTMTANTRLAGRMRGGHAPGHLREAFETWVEDGATASTVAVGWDDTTVPIRWLIGHLWNCSDIMPSGLCAQLDMPAGTTYARAVRHLRSTP